MKIPKPCEHPERATCLMYASSCTIGSEFNRHLQPVVRMKWESAPGRCDASACNATGTHCLCGELIEAIDDHFKSKTTCSGLKRALQACDESDGKGRLVYASNGRRTLPRKSMGP
jgi:hypothetical protein